MTLRASAPGKMVLLGEYAVLEGSAALVMAVDRRAVVEIDDARGHCAVHAPDVWPQRVTFSVADDGTPQWHDGAAASSLTLVAQVLRGLAAEALLPGAPFSLRLDTAAFFDAGSRSKLGLGSSAAMTVALASALAAHAGHAARVADAAGWRQTLLALHRAFQGGRGSGVDIAAAVHGGLLRFQRTDDDLDVRPVRWPAVLQRIWVWSGASASTTDFLTRLAHWRAAAPEDCARHMTALSGLADVGIGAADDGDVDGLRTTIDRVGQALQSLGDAAKMSIFSPPHQRIADIVRRAGGVYKPCGAGGGDLGLAVAVEGEQATAVQAALAAAGYEMLALGVDDAGLVLEQVDGD